MAICMAVVDLPLPPFSLPRTMTWEFGWPDCPGIFSFLFFIVDSDNFYLMFKTTLQRENLITN
jgi:hypothetical protein